MQCGEKCGARAIADNLDQDGDPKPKVYSQGQSTTTNTDGASAGVGLYAIILVGGILAFAAYKYFEAQQEGQ